MDLLLSQAYGSDCSDVDSMKGFLDYNIHIVPGEVAAVTTANLEEDIDVNVFTNEEGNPGAIPNYLGQEVVNSQDPGALVKYSPAEENMLTKLEATTRFLFPPDNSKVYFKNELCDALRVHG
jgi:hypothetical protein